MKAMEAALMESNFAPQNFHETASGFQSSSTVARTRVFWKACDRCRLKKAKVDHFI